MIMIILLIIILTLKVSSMDRTSDNWEGVVLSGWQRSENLIACHGIQRQIQMGIWQKPKLANLLVNVILSKSFWSDENFSHRSNLFWQMSKIILLGLTLAKRRVQKNNVFLPFSEKPCFEKTYFIVINSFASSFDSLPCPSPQCVVCREYVMNWSSR